MYLHLGQNTTVNAKDIIGIFDLDTSTVKEQTRKFLTEAEKENKVMTISEDLPKSFILCKKKNVTKIFISPLATTTLIKRHENWQMNF